ncbi:uncharacterized protein V6R79_017420 [Siganus canaliculatus]
MVRTDVVQDLGPRAVGHEHLTTLTSIRESRALGQGRTFISRRSFCPKRRFDRESNRRPSRSWMVIRSDQDHVEELHSAERPAGAAVEGVEEEAAAAAAAAEEEEGGGGGGEEEEANKEAAET